MFEIADLHSLERVEIKSGSGFDETTVCVINCSVHFLVNWRKVESL